MYINGGKMKKNILQVMPEFGLAGAETMCETLCYELKKSNRYNVYVASLFDFHSPITERMEEKGIKIFYIGKGRGIDLKAIFKLYKLMKDLRIDIVHTHRYVMQYAIPAAIMARVKTRVHTVHNIAEKEVDSFRQKIAFFFYHFCHVTPVSISPLIRDSVIARYSLKLWQSPIVYNGTDLSKCFVRQNYKAHNPFRFIHIGRFSLQKNHGVIISAAERLKADRYKFVINLIGGAGNEKERMDEVTKKGLNDVINFSGLQSDIFPFLSESDCFILPSLYEGMPVTLVEAMGCGMPVIASAVGGVPDMIENEASGILIEPNVDSLVNAMQRVMVDDGLRKSIGLNALTKSNDFSSTNMFNGYTKIYEQL